MRGQSSQRDDSPFGKAYTLPPVEARGSVVRPAARKQRERNLLRRRSPSPTASTPMGRAIDHAQPREMLGVADRCGSLEVGKSATLIVTMATCWNRDQPHHGLHRWANHRPAQQADQLSTSTARVPPDRCQSRGDARGRPEAPSPQQVAPPRRAVRSCPTCSHTIIGRSTSPRPLLWPGRCHLPACRYGQLGQAALIDRRRRHRRRWGPDAVIRRHARGAQPSPGPMPPESGARLVRRPRARPGRRSRVPRARRRPPARINAVRRRDRIAGTGRYWTDLPRGRSRRSPSRRARPDERRQRHRRTPACSSCARQRRRPPTSPTHRASLNCPIPAGHWQHSPTPRPHTPER